MIFKSPTLIRKGIFEGVMGINEYKEYQKMLTLEDRKDIVLISITEPKDQHYISEKLSNVSDIFVNGYHDVLETQFWDVTEDFLHYKTISDWQAKEIKDFILKNRDKKFLIHCKAGQSRSAGVAKAVECLINFNGNLYNYRTSESLLDNFERYSYNYTVFNKIVENINIQS